MKRRQAPDKLGSRERQIMDIVYRRGQASLFCRLRTSAHLSHGARERRQFFYRRTPGTGRSSIAQLCCGTSSLTSHAEMR